MYSFVTYSHSNCQDVIPAYLNRISKYGGGIECNLMLDKIFLDAKNIHIYDDSKNYSSEFVRILKNIPHEYFIYMQEDFILYDHIKLNEINYCFDVLKNSNLSFIRFIKCGHVSDINISKNLYLISKDAVSHKSSDCYSMQPTLWKKSDFIKLYEDCNSNYFGEHIGYTNSLNKLKMNGAYYYDNEMRIGNHHYSTIFPYIATAIVRGKWNYSQYPKELESLFSEFKIDKNIRGCV